MYGNKKKNQKYHIAGKVKKNHSKSRRNKGKRYTVKPVLRGHIWDKEKVFI